MSRLISPEELHNAAKAALLQGNEPVTDADWILVVNFWAANSAKGLEVTICKLMARIYNCPLAMGKIGKIGNFQYSEKVITRKK